MQNYIKIFQEEAKTLLNSYKNKDVEAIRRCQKVFGNRIMIIGISSFIEMLRVSSKINDNFYKQIVFGIAVSLLFQAFVTVGGGIKFIPLTGVTLPLISYGGSSIMSSTLMYFIVQAIYVRLRKEDKRNKNGKAK